MTTEPEEVLGRTTGEVDAAAAQRQLRVLRGKQRNRSDRVVCQHPGVLTSFTVKQRELQRAQRCRNASQSARHNLVAFVLRNRERPQRYIRRLKLVTSPRGSARPHDPLVSNERR